MYALPKDPFDPAEGIGTAFIRPPSSIVRSAISQQGRGINSTSNVVPLPTAAVPSVHATLALLRRFQRHAHNANAASFKLAEEFLGLVAGARRSFKFSAQIFSDGNAVLGVRNDKVDAQFEFMPNGVIASNIDVGDDEWDGDVPQFDGRYIPEIISK
ncbi:hypothetical protein [Methylobacterium sp. V23]|uniref:hypothetical protein n=1 Tax=Methylobacterium sp. V23 TaxID=2044878 RepID=UPI0011AFF5CD|nr:hypothetical protein [Methylobacterium sp. V23]